MVEAVVLEHQTVIAVEQVWTTQELTLLVHERNLDLRSRQAAKNKHHSEPCLHRRLGLRFGEVNYSAKSRDAFGSRMIGYESAQLLDRNKPRMKEEVRGHDPLGYLLSAAEIDHGSQWGCGWQSTAYEDLASSKWHTSNGCPRAPITAQRFWDGDLDWMARVHIQSMKPGGRESGESRPVGQSPRYCMQKKLRTLIQAGPPI